MEFLSNSKWLNLSILNLCIECIHLETNKISNKGIEYLSKSKW
jgi:hypothetical protein